jgi:ectoine hydroxylase-related dioxygenase (phytanoyl-CoA dioxygenase family)
MEAKAMARAELDPDLVAAYGRDGVVLLRGLLAPHWIELLAAGVERNIAEPGEWAQHYTPAGEPGQFFGDYCNWDRIPEYREAAFASGLAGVARQLMRSQTVRFFHEHVLVKEPGTQEITPWHHDQPYYCVDGDQNVSCWVALDPVPASAGVEFIAGSHRWDRWFVPRRFVDHVPYAEASERFELVPDLESTRDQHRIVSFDVEPGDVIAFHFRTLHGAPGTVGLSTRRRVVSFRWLGDDATFALRPWLHSPPFEQRDLVEGRPLDDDRFPLVV